MTGSFSYLQQAQGTHDCHIEHYRDQNAMPGLECNRHAVMLQPRQNQKNCPGGKTAKEEIFIQR